MYKKSVGVIAPESEKRQSYVNAVKSKNAKKISLGKCCYARSILGIKAKSQ